MMHPQVSVHVEGASYRRHHMYIYTHILHARIHDTQAYAPQTQEGALLPSLEAARHEEGDPRSSSLQIPHSNAAD